MKTAINILKALSDENRLRIVLMLKTRALCVCEIAEALSIADSTLSAHLKTLRLNGIINQRKDGRWIEYHIDTDEDTLQLIDTIEKNISEKKLIKQDQAIIKKVTREICRARE